MTQRNALIFAAFLAVTSPVMAQDAAPLSAIDWLSDSVAAPLNAPSEPPVAAGATAPSVTVTPLGDPSTDLVGLLPPSVTGLPRSLWSFSDEATLVALTQAEPLSSLPAMQDLLTVLMLAEADPPLAAAPHGPLFLARVDKLLGLAALDQAQALMEQAGTEDPAIFRRWFDVALLNGTEAAGCDLMDTRPAIAPTYAARIFCLARNGAWDVAALTLNTHRVLGDITPTEEDLISRFLDPDLFEGEPDLPPPDRVTPLVFRMREAIGQNLTTTALPLAFAHADLRPTTGWKARLEAAERLARAGALAPNILQSLYTSRTPSASGGVWERAKAFQRFDAAVLNGAPDKIAETLPDAWQSMIDIRAEVAFASLYADALSEIESPVAEQIQLLAAMGDIDGYLAEIANRTDPRALAVTQGLMGTTPPAAMARLVDDSKIGEALLRAIAMFNAGLDGDPQSVAEGLATFVAAGQMDVAKRAAVQYLILERAP